MNNISSKYTGNVTSKTNDIQVESKSNLDVQSRTDLNVESQHKQEKEAFLYTTKRNVSALFAKYL